jgi:hypothetical protein
VKLESAKRRMPPIAGNSSGCLKAPTSKAGSPAIGLPVAWATPSQ